LPGADPNWTGYGSYWSTPANAART
jgi:hypothetical protein